MQTKLTLSFVFIGLASCILGVFLPLHLVERDFSNVSELHSYERIQENIDAYIEEYGALEIAVATESFDSFMKRSQRDASGAVNVSGKEGGDKSASFGSGMEYLPFQLLAMDPNGVVLRDIGEYKAGETVPQDTFDAAIRITAEGKVVALASPIFEAYLTPLDMIYLSVVQQNLVMGALAATTLSIVLGFVFAAVMSSGIRKLNKAVRKIQSEKEVIHEVEVESDDEVGELTEAYNELNKELCDIHEKMQKLSIRDPLTGLFNRRHFDAQAVQFYENARRYGQPLSLMSGDLDNYTNLSIDYSYEINNLVMKKVGELIRANSRKSDVAAWYWGTSFVVLFSNTDRHNAAFACNKIKAAVSRFPWVNLDSDLQVSMSMGLTDDTSGGSVLEMLKDANGLLQKAKDQGGNQLVYAENPD